MWKWAKNNFFFSSWFQTSAVFWMLYAFFWVISRHLNFMCWQFGTLCLFHLHRHLLHTYLPMRWNRQSVPNCRHIEFKHWGITQKKFFLNSLELYYYLYNWFLWMLHKILTPAVTPLQFFFSSELHAIFRLFPSGFQTTTGNHWSLRNITKICLCNCFSYVLK